jgi:hypothetical protein
MVKRRDVIDWAPEKRQRAQCLFGRQTPEPEIQKYRVRPATQVILAVTYWQPTSTCSGTTENPHPRAGYGRSGFDHRLADAGPSRLEKPSA